VLRNNEQHPYSPVAGHRGVLAHEFGHPDGLHERYVHDRDPVECSGETTVMDTMRLGPLGWEHCDLLEGPVQADTNRVRNYWARGDTADHTTTVNGAIGTWRWSDAAWAEREHYLEFRYYAVEAQWSQWTLLNQTFHGDNIGVHKLYEPRTIEKTYDRRTYNSPPGWHGVCIWLYFIAHGTFGMDNSGWCVITRLG